VVISKLLVDAGDPVSDILEAIMVSQIERHNNPVSLFVKLVRQSAEPLLPRRIPQLHLNLRVVPGRDMRYVVHTNRADVGLGRLPFVKEFENGSLAHLAVTNDDDVHFALTFHFDY
jgi:hypothetical protein